MILWDGWPHLCEREKVLRAPCPGCIGAGLFAPSTHGMIERAARSTSVRPWSAKQIRALRQREGASQAVFARYLNVTTGLVSQWERGRKHPRGASLKLLTLIAKNGLEAV